jgi:hypothetical protein
MKRRFLAALFYFSVANTSFASNAALVIHEDLINGLFDALGDIYKDLGLVDVWIKRPKVTINGAESGFTARAFAKNVFMSSSYDVYGKVTIVPDLANDRLQIKIRDVTIRRFLGMDNFNISEWYDPSFDIPLQLPRQANVLGKKIVLEQVNPQVVMGDKQILLYSDVNFR